MKSVVIAFGLMILSTNALAIEGMTYFNGVGLDNVLEGRENKQAFESTELDGYGRHVHFIGRQETPCAKAVLMPSGMARTLWFDACWFDAETLNPMDFMEAIRKNYRTTEFLPEQTCELFGKEEFDVCFVAYTAKEKISVFTDKTMTVQYSSQKLQPTFQ